MKLDEFLPEYDFHEVHSTAVQASPAITLAAAKELRPSELSPLVFLMFSMRALPARLLGTSTPDIPGKTHEEPFLSQLFDGGFSLLAETHQEIVFGVIGQFWKLAGGEEMKAIEPQDFVDFHRTNFAKTAANLLVQVNGSKTILSTETRIWAPDAQTRRKFAFYWLLISLGSGWIRLMWLNAIKRRAQKNETMTPDKHTMASTIT